MEFRAPKIRWVRNDASGRSWVSGRWAGGVVFAVMVFWVGVGSAWGNGGGIVVVSGGIGNGGQYVLPLPTNPIEFAHLFLGALTVNLAPSGAVEAGGAWRIVGQASFNPTGASLASLAPGTYSVEFAPVPGYATPATQSVVIKAGQTAIISGTYGSGIPLAGPANLQLTTNGEVNAIVFEADGSSIIGGYFTAVNGVARQNIARLNPDGSLDATWNPECNGTVNTLALTGDSVYAGGSFTQIGGQNRNSIAKISLDKGLADPLWDPGLKPPRAAGYITAVYSILCSGSDVYFGGDFSNSVTSYLARTQQSGSGKADPSWRPHPNNLVRALAANGLNLYVGGEFTKVDEFAHSGLARISMRGNGQPDRDWAPQARASYASVTGVQALLVAGNDLVVGGEFNRVGQLTIPGSDGVDLLNLARIDLASGVVDTGWNPSAVQFTDIPTFALATDGANLFATIRNDIEKISLAGTLTVDGTWSATSNVNVLAVHGTSLYAGGFFNHSSGHVALGLAKIDTVTAEFDPGFSAAAQVPGIVRAIAKQPDGKLLIGGNFYSASGVPCGNVIRLNADDTVDQSWNPDADGQVNCIVVDGYEIFIGGEFANAGGVVGGFLARFPSMASDRADPAWRPAFSGFHAPGVGVNDLSADGNYLYFGGDYFLARDPTTFAYLNRCTELGSGAIDASWTPNPDGGVNALALSGTDLYAGGQFAHIGSVERVGIAKLSTANAGAADPQWNPKIAASNYSVVDAIVVSGTNLFAGGFFTSVNHVTVGNLVKISTFGAGYPDLTWKASTDNFVYSLAVGGTSLYVGGEFFFVDGAPDNYLAKLDTVTGNRDPGWDANVDDSNILENSPPQDSNNIAGLKFEISQSDQVFALLADGDDTFVGGRFTRAAGGTHYSLADLTVPGAPVIAQDPADPGLIFITPNSSDGPAVDSFQITGITGGTLFLADGMTPVGVGDFITAAQGNAGLTFLANGLGAPTLAALPSVNGMVTGLGVASATFSLDAALLPVFQLSNTSYSVVESSGSLAITVEDVGGEAGSVEYSITNGSAILGVDYVPDVAANGELTFEQGETSQTINVAITDNHVFEGNRVFYVSLTPPPTPQMLTVKPLTTGTTGTSVIVNGHAVVTIEDDNPIETPVSLTSLVAPMPAADASASLTITLLPTAADGQWKLDGDPFWRNSGSTATGLMGDAYGVLFKPVSDYLEPPPQTEGLTDGQNLSDSDQIYTENGTPAMGALEVVINPSSISDPSVAEASRAQWQLQGDTTWEDSGTVLNGLNSGIYTVVFKPVAGWQAPDPMLFTVTGSQTNVVTVTYQGASATTGSAPQLLSVAQATGSAPYNYNGEIETIATNETDPNGFAYGSGVLVQDRVVLTAAHVVFSDADLTYVNEAEWLFEQYNGSFQAMPQQARGWYVSSGYAAQRVADASAGVSSTDAQEMDVAALYFIQPAGRGGIGGYLLTDGSDDWLGSNRAKMLVGYPLNPADTGDWGKMFATDPAKPVNFTELYGSVYSTTDIYSYPGNSGGPVYVRADDGTYYPAGVYLGGSGQTLVHAIDGAVVNLIDCAELSADAGGQNFDSGGSNDVGSGGGGNNGVSGITCILGPPQAVAAGAAWRVYQSGGDFLPTKESVPEGPGSYPIEFKHISHFVEPPMTPVSVPSGGIASISKQYLPAIEVTASVALDAQGISRGVANGGTYVIGSTAEATATPNGESAFASWTENGTTVSTAAHYTFPATVDRVLVANFVPGPFVPYQGSYHGYLRVGGTAQGFAALTLSPAGVFTASITYEGRTYRTHGVCNPNGAFSHSIPRTQLMLNLQVDLTNGTGDITGSLVDGVTTSNIVLGSTPLYTKANPAPEAGSYTMLLPPDPANAGATYPQGYGYGTVFVDPTGAVRVTGGSLGDGAAFSLGSGVTAGGQWPFFTMLEGGDETIAGTLTFESIAGVSDFDGVLDWVKVATGKGLYPGGFVTQTTVIGSHYASVPGMPVLAFPSGADNGEMSFGAGNLPGPQPTEVVTLKADNSILGGAGFKMKISVATGEFKGSFLDTTNKAHKFGGVVFQTGTNAKGLFEGDEETGSVDLEAH